MAKLLYCWELGDDLGHISSFVPLATELCQRGHTVVVALREVQRAQQLLGHLEGLTILPAPVWHGVPAGTPKIGVSYADLLYGVGFGDPAGLASMVRAWRDLFGLISPDLVIVDHGPTALLAARTLGLPSLTYGAGFCAPPSVFPFPNIRSRWDVPIVHLLKIEARVLGSINRILHEACKPALAHLSELFPKERNILLTYAELDHYKNRKDGEYFGPVINPTWTAKARWTEGKGKKVFAYLKARHQDFELVLTTLTALDCRSVVFAGEMPTRERQKYCTSRVQMLAEPIDIHDAVEQCALVVSHGGIGTIASALLGGKPLFLLPMHHEQGMQTARLVELGAALTVESTSSEVRPDYRTPIARLLFEGSFTQKASEFAIAHRSPSQSEIVASIADRCERELTPPLRKISPVARTASRAKRMTANAA